MPFKKGEIANPTGKSGAHGFAPWNVRVKQLGAKYDTIEKLMALFEPDTATGKMKPTKAFLQMNPIDGGIIWGMLGQLMGDDKRNERESFWNRREGKPVERRDVRVIRSLSDLTEEELIAIAAESGVADDRE